MDDHDRIRQQVERDLGDPAAWPPWPGRWLSEIATSLIDAVYSAQAVYETRNQKGILPKVKAWREGVGADDRDSLVALAVAIGDSPEAAARWATRFGNCSLAPGRRKRLPDDPLKSAAVRDAANRLISAGYGRSSDIGAEDRQPVRATMRSVSGIGKVTADYFLILLGHGGVKADVMVHRFLTRATERSFAVDEAVAAVTAVATRLGQPVTDLEHAIWAFESARAKG